LRTMRILMLWDLVSSLWKEEDKKSIRFV